MPAKFIELAGQLVREDAIVRLSRTEIPGTPNVTHHYVYFVDGASASVSEAEYRSLEKRLRSKQPTERK